MRAHSGICHSELARMARYGSGSLSACSGVVSRGRGQDSQTARASVSCPLITWRMPQKLRLFYVAMGGHQAKRRFGMFDGIGRGVAHFSSVDTHSPTPPRLDCVACGLLAAGL